MIAFLGIHSNVFLYIAGVLLVIALILAGIEDSREEKDKE